MVHVGRSPSPVLRATACLFLTRAESASGHALGRLVMTPSLPSSRLRLGNSILTDPEPFRHLRGDLRSEPHTANLAEIVRAIWLAKNTVGICSLRCNAVELPMNT